VEDDSLLTLDAALWELRRAWTTSGSLLRWEERLGVPKALAQVSVVEAVAAGPGVDERGREVTVGLVSTRLRVDDSTASRLVSDAVEAGYLHRSAPPVDRRRSRLTVTAKGRRLRDRAKTARRAVLASLLDSWDQADVDSLAKLLSAFAAELR
jgi:DNA-binding MarR family transcriptional regulator